MRIPKFITRVRALGLALVFAAGYVSAQEGSIDHSFNPGDPGYGMGDVATGGVRAIATQGDGKILIGGDFVRYNNTIRQRIARTLPDGSLDPSFDPGSGANSSVATVAVQPDGKILIGGYFTSYNGSAHNYICRLNADGTADPTFITGTGANGVIHACSVQADGKILIAGSFTSFNGTARGRIARLNADGSLDPGFVGGSGASYTVRDCELQADGKILITGDFTSYAGSARSRIARLNVDGTVDIGFVPGSGADNFVHTCAIQADGKIIIGGDFSVYDGTGRNRIARLSPTGALDSGFNPDIAAINTVYTIRVQPNGKVLVSGNDTVYNGVLARLNADGSPDVTFEPGSGPNNSVLSTSLQSDGKILVGGHFIALDGSARNYLARMLPDGSLDDDFNPGHGANDIVHTCAIRTDGKVMIGGQLTGYNGVYNSKLTRLNQDGTHDPTFDPGTGADGGILALAIQADQKVVIGGHLGTYDGTARAGIARINADGSLDTSFDPGTGTGRVNGIALQPDGKILIVGWFNAYDGAVRNHIARLNADGSLDTGFDPGYGAVTEIKALALAPDGKLIIGGTFQLYNSAIRNRVARINADGTVDPSFTTGSGANNTVYACAIQQDGKVLIAGDFTSYAGTGRNRIARLQTNGALDAGFAPGTGADGSIFTCQVLPDGKILIGGSFTSFNGVPRNRLARLNPDGSLDMSFNPGGTGANGQVYTCAIEPDGQIVAGGNFTAYNGTGRNRIARINGTPRASLKVNLEGPYSSGLMNDALRNLPSFPLTEPFTAMGYAETGYVSGATIGSSVLSTTANNAIVDWVLVEMRPASTPGTVAASRSVLLQRDGDVVDLDGVSTVGFAGLATGNYCVAVKPRNHLPVMLSATTPVSYGAANAAVDFTLSTTLVHDNDARKNVGGVMVAAAGDVTFNETVSYTGAGNDRDPILIRVGSATPNATVSGYWREDVNMDGVVKYTGSANDRDIILTNVGSTTPNHTRVAALP